MLRGRADRNEATTRAGRREGQGEGNAGRPEGPPGTPLREVLVATVREVCEGRSAGTVGGGHTLRGAGGGLPKGVSPGGLGGVPAVPGLRHVPGLPGFPALGASGRVAAAPPSPSERSAAAGPNHRSHRGGGGALPLAAPFGSLPPPGLAAARPRCGAAERCSAALGRAAALDTAGSARRRQRHPPPPCAVAQSGERRAPRLWVQGRAEGAGSSTPPG